MRFQSKLIIIYMLSVVLCAVGYIYLHEEVHVAIYRNYGIESHVEYFSHFPLAVTIADEPCPTETCVLANDINEAVGYPLQVIFGIIAIGLLILLILLDVNHEERMWIALSKTSEAKQ